MRKKLRRPISLLLAMLMVVSLFAIVPMTASAEELSGYVEASNLKVGDILGSSVSGLEAYGYTLTLVGGGHGTDEGVKSSDTVTSFFDWYRGGIMDIMVGNLYYPYDNNGNQCEAFIVTAVDHSAETFTLTGYVELDGDTVKLNQSVRYRYFTGVGYRTGNTPLDSTYKVVSDNKKWADGTWYVVTENVIFEKRIEITGTVNLVLCDGVTLTAKQGIKVNSGNALNIYAQNGGTGTLYAGTTDGTSTTMNSKPENAALGGDAHSSNGNICIHSGIIKAVSHTGAAGIGGGQDSSGGNINIYGGDVTAGLSNGYASSIGGGYLEDSGNISVLGGTLTAFAKESGYSAAIGNVVNLRNRL